MLFLITMNHLALKIIAIKKLKLWNVILMKSLIICKEKSQL